MKCPKSELENKVFEMNDMSETSYVIEIEIF